MRWDAAIKGVQQVRFPEHLPLNGDVDYPKLEVNPHRAARVVGYDLPYLLLHTHNITPGEEDVPVLRGVEIA